MNRSNQCFGRRLCRHLTLAMAAYAAALGLAWSVGLRMFNPAPTLMHFLSPELLTNRLLESIFYLHAQPPMLNLLAGLTMKLARAAGVSVESVMLVFQLAAGAVVMAGLAWLATRMLRPWAAVVCILIFAFHPFFYVTIHQFFYTLHETALLAAMPFFLWRYLNRRRTVDLAALCLLAAALVYTRSLFHFAWALGLYGALYLMLPVADQAGKWSRRRSQVAVLVLAAILVLAWPVKNLALFGTFSYSSWQGMNVSSMLGWRTDLLVPNIFGIYEEEDWGGTPVRWTDGHADVGIRPHPGVLRVAYWLGHPDISPARPVRVTWRVEEEPTAMETHARGGYHEKQLESDRSGNELLHLEVEVDRTWVAPDGRRLGVGLYRPRWETIEGAKEVTIDWPPRFLRQVPARLRHVAVLTETTKPSGGLNWNHYAVIDYCRRRQRLALKALRRDPASLLAKAAYNYLCFARFSGRNPYGDEGSMLGILNPPRSNALHTWMRIYELALCQEARDSSRLGMKGLSPWPPSGFMILFPIVMIFSTWKIVRRWRIDPARARVALLMLYCILWVLAMVLFVDGLEGNRMRFSTLPYLLVLFFWILPPAAAVTHEEKALK
jgi:hypothetical protein